MASTALCEEHAQYAGTARSAAVPNAAMVVLALYVLYYTALEPFAGLSWGVLLALPMWLSATAFAQRVPYAWAWAIGVHVVSWFVQARSGYCCASAWSRAWQVPQRLHLGMNRGPLCRTSCVFACVIEGPFIPDFATSSSSFGLSAWSCSYCCAAD